PDDPDRARFYWLDEEVPYSADEVLAANIARRETRRDLARKEAVSLLRRELAHGPRLATEIERIATEHGISRATLRRAKEDLGVVSNR
ncbi:hypothetical protein OFN40_29960, partial [Escherichia coli]|nr:hypothetical protein [Escherichia coli]